MAELFTREYHLLWTALLALVLFFPVRKLIWVLSVRRAQARGLQGRTKDTDQDEAGGAAGYEPPASELDSLRRRAGVTAGLLVFIFAFFYTASLLPA